MAERRDLPLFRWDDERRAARVLRCRLAGRGALLAAGIAALTTTIVVPPAPRLVWNASASMPRGLYLVIPGLPVRTGQMVVAWPPRAVRALAAERHYLPIGVPLVKRVGAVPGDRVCANRRRITVEGRGVADRLDADRAGRQLPAWTGCRTLHGGSYLLLATDRPDSFDGRYFGPTEASDIIGRARLLWAR
jgi:conjugative transfer signal peptidase TraF